MNLVYYPNPILDKALTEVNVEDPGFDPVKLKKDMIDLMVKSKGLGLSACQVGLNYKLFVMGESHKTSMMVINPEIIEVSEETVNEFEGCLSFPGVFVNIPRPVSVSARWLDENFESHEGTIEGYGARCFLHEYEHLNGVVYKSKVSRLKWDRALKKKGKIDKQRMRLADYIRNVEAAKKDQEEVLDLNTLAV